MKRTYEQPLAEKVVFDYAENVVAGSTSYSGGCNGFTPPANNNSGAPAGDGLRNENGVWWYKDQKVNNDPYGGWACKSTDHNGCYQF
ncbi:MAG: hypothetical protein K6F61_01840 [Clostridiales bacterium]|nr:hypothetical protein [Clostridiales bacterium]